MTGRARIWWSAVAMVAATLSAPALAQDAPVNVYQYAVDHPVEDATVNFTPSLGSSVPQGIRLAAVGDNGVYGYFYFRGRPVIVEMSTRSVVRLE